MEIEPKMNRCKLNYLVSDDNGLGAAKNEFHEQKYRIDDELKELNEIEARKSIDDFHKSSGIRCIATIKDIEFFFSMQVKKLNLRVDYTAERECILIYIELPYEDCDLWALILHRLEKLIDPIIPINLEYKILSKIV